MEPHEYETLFQFESTYWWYRGLHAILLDILQSLGCGSSALLLDAGCGTGKHLANVRDLVTGHSSGFDLAAEAIPFWKRRSLDTVCRGSANEIPFKSETFDFLTCVDLLECSSVNEQRAYQEMLRVLKKGGYLLLVVPAYDWLMNEEHHKAVHASRRYTRGRMRALLEQGEVEILRMTHLFSTVLPLVAAHRLVLDRVRRRRAGVPTSDLRPINPVLNNLLVRIMTAERRLLRSFNLPFGSSILSVAQKIG
ncbi:MAG: class I SAM-dependent methyltransferase [Thermodesulfobacteriota bacterium]